MVAVNSSSPWRRALTTRLSDGSSSRSVPSSEASVRKTAAIWAGTPKPQRLTRANSWANIPPVLRVPPRNRTRS